MSGANDLAFPDLSFVIGAAAPAASPRVRLHVACELDPQLVQAAAARNDLADTVRAALQLQKCVAELMTAFCAAGALAGSFVNSNQPASSVALRVLVVGSRFTDDVVDGESATAEIGSVASGLVVRADLESWAAFCPQTAGSSGKDFSLALKTADFLLNACCSPSLLAVALRLFAAAGGSSISSSAVLAACIEECAAAASVSAPTRRDSAAFAGGFRLVCVALVHVACGNFSASDLFLHFAQERNSLQGEAGATVADLSRVAAEERHSISSAAATAAGQRRGRACDDGDDRDVGDLEERICCGFGRPTFEHALRRRSSALLVWSTLRRLAPSRDWIASIADAAASFSALDDLSNLLLVGAASGPADDEYRWLQECAVLRPAAFLVAPEPQPEDEDDECHFGSESSAALLQRRRLCGASGKLWWRSSQRVCARLSFDMERRDVHFAAALRGNNEHDDAEHDDDDDEVDKDEEAARVLKALNARIDCCVVTPPPAPRSSGDPLASMHDSVDQFLAECHPALATAQRRRPGQDSVGFCFPVLLLHVTLIPSDQPQFQRIVLCVYGAIAGCAPDSPCAFSEDAATILRARDVRELLRFEIGASSNRVVVLSGQRRRRHEYHVGGGAAAASQRAMEFQSACHNLAMMPFGCFLHAVMDPSCTAPRALFHLLESSTFAHPRTAALQFVVAEMKQLQQQQAASVLYTLVAFYLNHEMRQQHLGGGFAPPSPSSLGVVTTASAMAASVTFATFADMLVNGDATWVQRFLPPPPAATWQARFASWGNQRVAFIVRRAIAHHVQRSFTHRCVAAPNKQQPQQQEPQSMFSSQFQLPVLRDEMGGFDDDFSSTAATQFTQHRAPLPAVQRRQAAPDVLFQVTQQSASHAVHIATLKRWLKALSSGA